MNKVVYLNSHLEKFREKSEIKIDLEDLRGLAHYSNISPEDKKTTKIFTKCFKNKGTYKDLIEKLPNYWVAYVNYYHNDKFEEEMGKCLESIDENVVLLDSPHFCKKVYYYLNTPKVIL